MSKKQRVEKLLKQPLSKEGSIAFICSSCLGDTLMGLVTVNNLIRNGYQVDVYGDYAFALQDWFPQFKIFPFLKQNNQFQLKNYAVVLHLYDSKFSQEVASWHPVSITLSESIYYLADMTMTDIQVTLCRQEFALNRVERVNRIQPPADLQFRKYKNRIVLHPTSSLPRKNWPPKKFLELTKKLRAEGLKSYFIVSPNDRQDWLWVEKAGVDLPNFSSLSDVASFIYESSFFIGNDSGIGHLASNLGIPTVSIILRKGVAKQWRPSWAPGKVVLSPSWLNPRPIKEKLWKKFTRVAKVKAAFDKLRNEVNLINDEK